MRWATNKKAQRAPRKRGIFKKLLAGYIALTLIIVTLTALVSYFLIRDYTFGSNLQELYSKAEAIAEMISMPGGTAKMLTRTRFEEMQALSGATLAYIYPNFSVRQLKGPSSLDGEYDSEDEYMIDVRESLSAQMLRDLLNGTSITDVQRLDFMPGEVVFAGAPVFEADDTVHGAVLLYRPLTQVAAATQQFFLMLLIAGAVSIFAATWLAYFMGKKLTDPLVAMNRTAAHIASGNYGEHVELTTHDEVSELGGTLNFLSTNLAQVIRNLNEEKSKLEKVLSSIGEGIIAIDGVGNVVHHNNAALELLNLSSWQPLNEPGQLGHIGQLIEQLNESIATRSRKELSFEVARRTLEAVSAPIIAEHGAIYGAVCTLRDISELQRLEKMRRDYIANISHELRTPLTGIRGMVEPLLDGYMETEEEKQDCYRIIYQETRRLERLIGEMLDLSRLQDGRSQMELEPMEIVPLLEAARRRLMDKATDGEVDLLVEADDANVVALGNENRIIQVLIILIDNALSFTPEGGKIVLSARRDGNGFVELSVADTGSGISPDDLPYIWERFYKADRSRLRTQGVGLGLAIAKLIVELMGGTIGVETEVGAGSKFTFTVREWPSQTK